MALRWLMLLGISSWMADAQVRIIAPPTLRDRLGGRIDGSTAVFGAPFYGDRLMGKLAYAPSNGNAYCTDGDYAVPPPDETSVKNHEQVEVKPLNIFIVRRGTCSFVKKVRIAQAKSAHAVIIVDKEDSHLTASDIRHIIVADDGYGNLVDIPSILVSREEGEALIAAVQTKTEPVIIELVWDVPTDHVVLVDQWTSSASRESFKFLKEFKKKREALNEVIQYVPHYHIFSMTPPEFNELCIDKDAKFCAEDPDGSGPITGRMVIEEDLRQLCIHELYKVSRTHIGSSHKIEYSREFWDYISRILDDCSLDGSDVNSQFGKTCSERLMGRVGIDPQKVQHCVDTTQHEKLVEQSENVAWSPRALRINQWRYSGSLDADLVTRAVCAGFINQPDACKGLAEPHPVLQKINQASGGVSFTSFISTLLIIVVVAMGALFLYKRSLTSHIHSALREEVMLEVQAQMDSYKKMAG